MRFLFNGICRIGARERLTICSRVITHKATDFYIITTIGGKFHKFYFLLIIFSLSGIACICYKNQTHIQSRMNTPNPGPIIEVISQPAEVRDETRVSRETETAIHPFGSVLLRLELALSLICVRRTRACPSEARTRVRPTG